VSQLQRAASSARSAPRSTACARRWTRRPAPACAQFRFASPGGRGLSAPRMPWGVKLPCPKECSKCPCCGHKPACGLLRLLSEVGEVTPGRRGCVGVRRSTNEKNRRRDLVNALRTRREAMLQALKRDQHSANRHAPLSPWRSFPAGCQTRARPMFWLRSIVTIPLLARRRPFHVGRKKHAAAMRLWQDTCECSAPPVHA
jgi:hypothetical protein